MLGFFKQRFSLIPMLGIAFVGACSNGNEPEASSLLAAFTNLEVLNATTEGTYEGWVIDADGNPHTTGKFTLNNSGQHTFPNPIEDAMMFVLTVEPPGDSDAIPSDQKLLGGPIVNGTATLSALGFVSADPAADFSSSPGTQRRPRPDTYQ